MTSSSKNATKGKNSAGSRNAGSSKVEQYNELMEKMSKAKDQWDKEEDPSDKTDQLLSNAIELALEQGRGWAPGEKEKYLEQILDDDFIPPLFCSSPQELEKSGLADAFTSLKYEGESPTRLYLQFKQKASEAYSNGRRNEAGNMQYYRDAVNFYYEALACATHIEPMQEGDLAQADTDDPTFTAEELEVVKSQTCSNAALMHMQLKNWGLVRDECKKALAYSDKNVKAWYRLAKAMQMLKEWEAAGDAITSGLAAAENDAEKKDLFKLQNQIADRVHKARIQRQQRERKRAERVASVKQVWKHCNDVKNGKIQLGRLPLVASVSDDDVDTDPDYRESHWHYHFPHSGVLPSLNNNDNEWYWPCMFLYPSHQQSDFVQNFAETDMLAIRMAIMFPELEDGEETAIPWDHNNEFVCSKLAVYFEVHESTIKSIDDSKAIIHPDAVEALRTQAECMKFYESSRALKGDEGPEIANVIQAVERKHLYQQQSSWRKKHGSLWHNPPDSNPVVRVHPAITLREVLHDSRMIVPNFMVTFLVFPENHPAHEAYLKSHSCVGVLQPKEVSS